MKKILSLMVSFAIIAAFTSGAYAEDQVGPYQKGERGVKKIVKSPLAVTDSVKSVTKEHNPIFGLTFGVIEGSIKFVTDIISGAADVVTAPIGSYDAEIKQIEVEPIKK